jgi:hypothetical protein
VTLREAASRRGSFLGTLKAVAWSFFGVRKSSDNEKDLQQLNPLVMFVRWIVGSGIAA